MLIWGSPLRPNPKIQCLSCPECACCTLLRDSAEGASQPGYEHNRLLQVVRVEYATQAGLVFTT